MRNHLPASSEEYVLADGEVIITRTDNNGNIVYANDAFIRSSGFVREEVVGSPQSIVRHPDMPAKVFADMWKTLKQDQPWTGIIKNRRRSGGFYWALAHITPVFESGRKIGYMSVRTKASMGQIATAGELYGKIRQGKDSGFDLRGGEVIPKGMLGLAGRLLRWPVHIRLWAVMLTLVSIALLDAVCATSMGKSLGSDAMFYTVWTLFACSAAIAVGATLYLSGQVLRPLKILSDMALEVATGKVQAQFPEQGDVATRQLGRMLNQMNAKVVGVLLDAKTAIAEIQISSKEQAARNAGLSQRNEEQAGAVEETTASLSQMAETSRQNTARADEVTTAARTASAAASAAASEVKKVVNLTSELGQQSKTVSEIASVIDEIAFRTTILALNAAVEAARAGESGRSFAVVAGEVRSLSVKTAEAAKEIKRLLTNSGQAISDVEDVAATAGASMNGVESMVNKLMDSVSDIARASRDQSQEIVNINAAMSHVAQLTEHNAGLVEETAEGAFHLERQAMHLEDGVNVFMLGKSEQTRRNNVLVLPRAENSALAVPARGRRLLAS